MISILFFDYGLTITNLQFRRPGGLEFSRIFIGFFLDVVESSIGEDVIISIKPQETDGLYHFSKFRLDTAERRLWCEDEPVSLTSKQFDLLFYFVENAGRVAKKDELLEAVWTDSYVEESTLARNVSWLRQKFKECADEPLIETVSKLGYRFAAEVTITAANENILIVDERTIQHFRGEEIITIDDGDVERTGEKELAGNEKNELASITSPQRRRRIALSPLVLGAFAFVTVIGVGFFVYQNYFRTSAMKAIEASHVVPFSGVTGVENSPAYSPNGTQLVYSWNGGSGEASDIYVKLVGAGEPLQLTKTDVNEHYPTFSPDGNYVAFVRGKYGEPGEVILVPALGGRERRVARLFSGNYSISYSPDGQHIAVIDTEDSTEGGQFAVYLVNIDSGERRRLTPPADFLGETTPRFSLDGKRLAFIRVFREDVHGRYVGKQDLFVVPTSGGEPQQLTFDGLIINSLTWSADDFYIYFVPVRPPNRTIMRRVPATGGEQEIVATGSENITNIDISPDGRTMVYAEEIRRWKIWRVGPDGRTGTKLIDSHFIEFFPQFSPDGSRIAFQTDRTGKSEIWTMDANGEDLRQITETQFPSSAPQFSPDGSQIAFNQKENDDFANYIVSAVGGEPQRLSPKGLKEDFPIWSPDGSYIYFTSSRSGEPNIWKMRADGTGDPMQITMNGAHRGMPSPDGKSIYFIKFGVTDQLWRIPAEGGTEEVLPAFQKAGFYSYWTIKPTGIYFLAASAGGGFKLRLYDFANGQMRDVGGSYKIPANLEGYQITFDNNILICSILDRSSRLMLADLQ